jgi:hypothetical protein
MNKENAIKQIRENLKKILHMSKQEEFGSFVLSDGTKITTDSEDLEVGAKIYALDDLGNQSVCEKGSYVLQDGRTIVCDESGVITEVKMAEGEEKPEAGDVVTDKPETMASEGLPKAEAEGKKKMEEEVEVEEKEEVESEDSGERISKLEEQVTEILNILSKMGDSQNELNKQMMSAIQKFGAEPGDEPVKFAKKGYKDYVAKVSQKQDESFEELKKLMKKRKSMFK